MDRNQATGIMLILLLLFVYFQFFAPNPQPKKVNKDTSGVQSSKQSPEPTTANDSVLSDVGSDSIANEKFRKTYGDFAVAATGEEKEVVIENEDIKVTLSTKGGRVKRVLLKNYQTYDKKPLVLIDEENHRMSFSVPTKTGDIPLYDLHFTTTSSNTQVAATDTARISFRLALSPNQYIEQVYTLGGAGFQVGYDVRFVGLDNVIKNEPIQFYWLEHLKKLELDMEQSRITSTINYYSTEEEFEQLDESSKDAQKEVVTTPIKWVSLKQKFFLSSIIARNTAFAGGELASSVDPADSNTVKTLEARLQIPTADLKSGKGSFTYYFGPNDYQIIEEVAEDFGDNVYLGWPIVRVINKYVIVWLFHLLEQVFSSYGIIIILLVLIIRVMLLPLSYKSYISLAKTRVLQPEIQAIKEKHGDDMQKVQQEQMKLYQQVGVNPLSGCIPMLLQMPILLALFSLFPNLIEFRQESFLWADDLSTYDSIASLPFVVPFYGSHVSLFTILMTISSVAFAYFNSQMTASTMQGPMQSLQYIMPLMFMFILNSLPAALTFYYFVSNVVSIAQQLIIRNFVDEEKIRRTLDENKLKNKDKKKSKFQQRLEDALKAAEESKKKK